MKTPLRILSFVLCASAASFASAQGLEAHLLMKNNEVWNVLIRPRAPDTSSLQVTRTDRGGNLTLPLADVRKIHFNLESLAPDVVNQHFQLGRYAEVVNALRGKVNPYFAFVDQDANSNELVSLFIRSLYLSGNPAGVKGAADEVAKYAREGPVRRLSLLTLGLCYIDTNNQKGLDELKGLFADPELNDPLASTVWFGQAKLALKNNDWAAAHIPLAKIITETPMDIEWVGEALFQTAQHHHSKTNLVVAYQICQEIAIVAPTGPWIDKSNALLAKIEADAIPLGIPLVKVGEVRKRERETGESKIDYRDRQRQLEGGTPEGASETKTPAPPSL